MGLAWGSFKLEKGKPVTDWIPESRKHQRFYWAGVHNDVAGHLRLLTPLFQNMNRFDHRRQGGSWRRNSNEWGLTRIRTKPELRRTGTMTSILSVCKAVWFSTNKNQKYISRENFCLCSSNNKSNRFFSCTFQINVNSTLHNQEYWWRY